MKVTLSAMRHGKIMAFNFDKMDKAFENSAKGCLLKNEILTSCPLTKILDHDKWLKDHNDYIKAEDKIDIDGNQVGDKFPLDPKFQIAVVIKSESEEVVLQWLEALPHIEDFHKIILK